MEIGIGLDQSLKLPFPAQRELVRRAATLGYTSAWTPSGATTPDAFQTCVQWSMADAGVTSGGLMTGISVVPAPVWSPVILADMAATTSELTEGHLILGLGAGSIYTEQFRHSFNLPAYPAIKMMREYLVALRQLLTGERVDCDGVAVTLHGVRLSFQPPPVPLYLAALGPRMLRLAGEIADGVALNWSTPEQIAWSREQIVAGAQRAGRNPAEVRVVQYIRVCVDGDEDLARRAFTRAVMGYALARPGASKEFGYRAHFGRMGFEEVLTDLETRRDSGASEDELIDRFPADLLRRVGYFGPAAGAAAALRQLAQGLDVAIVRVVVARPGVESVADVMEACSPTLVLAG